MATKEEFDDAIKLIVQRKKYTFSASVGRLMMDDAWWNLANAKNAECVTKTLHDDNESWFCQSCTKFLYTYDQVRSYKEIKLLKVIHP